MPPFLETSETIQLVVEYVGFAPSRYYLKQCSRYLYCEVSGIVRLNATDFLEAVNRALVNPKYLRLEAGALSDSLMSNVAGGQRYEAGFSIILESIHQSKSIDELMNLERGHLQTILAYSLLRMNKSIFDITLNCMETRGCVRKVMLKFLQHSTAQEALMMADALELLERMVDYVPPGNDSLFENLLVQATKFQAQKCSEFLKDFTRDFEMIPGMLQAYAYTGDMDKVKMLCGNASVDSMEIALKEAVIMGHLEVAAFLRVEWKNRDTHSTKRREWLVGEILDALMRNPKRSVTNRLLRDGPSEKFLTWLFEGFNDSEMPKFDDWLVHACDRRYTNLFRYLVGRGCTFRRDWPTLGKTDLLDFFELDAPFYTWNPTMEMFLLKRGIHIRTGVYIENPVTEILFGGFNSSSFADRVDLIKLYLLEYPTCATKIASVSLPRLFNCVSVNLTPFGMLALFGTPRIDIWSGKNLIRFADIVDKEQQKNDEWTSSRPNDIELQALQDIRAALVQHGADPQNQFEPDILHEMLGIDDFMHAEVVRRVIQGRADVNKKDKRGYSPLSKAFRTFRPVDVIEALLDGGATVESENWSDRWSRGFDYEFVARNTLWAALGTFAVIRNPNIFRLLLDRKMDPNVPQKNDTDGEGLTPLSWILALNVDGKHAVADLLLQYKANINATDSCGRTAIFRAIALGDAEGVALLIKYGADLRITDKHGVRPIDIARCGVHDKGESASKHIIEAIENVIGEADVRVIDGHRSVSDLFSNNELCWDFTERGYKRYSELCEYRGWIYW